MFFSLTHVLARPRMVGGIIFLIAAAFSGWLIWQHEQHSMADERISVASLSGEHVDAIEYTIERALTAAHAMAALVRQGNGTVPNFVASANKILPYYPGASELALAPEGVVRYVAPTLGNEMAIGLDLLTDPIQRKESLLARDSGQLTLAGPLELVQGGTGIIGRLPVFLEDRRGHSFFWGFVLVVIRLPSGLNMAHLSHLDEQGLAYELWRTRPENRQKQMIARSQSAVLSQAVEQELRLPNARWTLSAAPVKGWWHPLRFSLEAALAFLFSLLAGFMSKIFVELKLHKQLLEQHVIQRTAAIHAAQHKLQVTLNAIPDLVWLKDTNGIYLCCNPMFERVFGVRESDIIGKTDYDFVDSEQADFFREHDRRAIEARKPCINEEWLNFANNGCTRLFETIKTPLLDSQGETIGVLGISRDITLRVQTERELIESRQRAQQYLNLVGVMLIAVNAEGCVQLVNRKGCEMLGAAEADILGKDWFDNFLPERIRVEVKHAFIRLLEGGSSPVEYMETAILTGNGEERVVAWNITLLLDNANSVNGMLASGEDITERKHYMAELEHKALYDSLTDLPNRILFTDRLKLALVEAQQENKPLSIILLNIARLNEVNDILGHHNGDIVVQEVGRRIAASLCKSDTLARLSGGEFAILLTDAATEQAVGTITTIQNMMESPTLVDGDTLDIEVYMGLAVSPQHGEESSVLLSRADVAMRLAKTEVSGFCIYDASIDQYSRRRLSLLGELRQAIALNKLVLYYQPQIDLASGRVMGVEALLRWPRSANDMVSPLEFIPLAEQTGLIRPMTLWVLEQAIQQCVRWRETGLSLKVSVNLSARNLLDPTLPYLLAKMLKKQHLTSESLMLEVTESAVMLHPERALQTLTQLNQMGSSISVDDFGTGYSSLAYLKKLPVSELKIDQSFVFGMVANVNDAVIVRSTIDLAHNLGLRVVAEGVEDQETLRLLVALGCDVGQGYLFGRPMPAEEVTTWLSESPWGVPIRNLIRKL